MLPDFFFFLAKNETLALPAESKTPKVEKIPAQPITGNETLVSLTLREYVIFFQMTNDRQGYTSFSVKNQ